MTTPAPPLPPGAYWHCPDGRDHAWNYRRDTTEYLCTHCLMRISKADLKRATDK